MKLLFDQNLSFKLCDRLSDIFPDSDQARLDKCLRGGCDGGFFGDSLSGFDARFFSGNRVYIGRMFNAPLPMRVLFV